MIDLGLEGRRAVVVGAGHRPPRPGIGRETAKLLAQGGAKVACVDLDETRAEAVASEINATGGEAFAVVGDMRRPAEVERAFGDARARLGGLDVCVDIVGEATWGSVRDFTEDDWDWAVETNLKQMFLVFQAAGRIMQDQGTGGAMAGVASVDGLLAAPQHVAYGCAKAGVVHLVKTMSEELGPSRIRINAVAPGAVFIPSDEEPEPRPGAMSHTPYLQPAALDIARGLVFFCSDLANAVSGQTLPVDGGASVKGAWDMTAEAATRIRAS